MKFALDRLQTIEGGCCHIGMKRVGRNEPCPCLSGLKFKKCCGRVSGAALALMPKRFGGELREILNDNGPVLQKLMRARARQALKRLDSLQSTTPPEGDFQRCLAQLSQIAQFVSETIPSGQRSRHYWYPLVRRCVPVLLDWLYWEGDSVSVEKSMVCVAAGRLTALSTECAAGEAWAGSGMRYRINEEVLGVVAKIAALSRLYFDLQGNLRLAGKGVPLKDASVTDRLTLDSISDYQERRDKFDTFTGSCGLWCDLPVDRDPPQDITYFPGAASAKKARELPVRCGLDAGFLSRWVLSGATDGPGEKHLVPWRRLLDYMSAAASQWIGVPTKTLDAFLYSLGGLTASISGFSYGEFRDGGREFEIQWPEEMPQRERDLRWNFSREIGELALVRESPQHWVQRLVEISEVFASGEASISALTSDEAEGLIRRFSFGNKEDNPRESLALFVPLSENGLALDLLVAGDFLHNLLVGCARRTENVGAWLEKQAASFFQRELGLERERMIVGRRIAGGSREVDLAFVYERTLFVIDCKAKAKDAVYLAGYQSPIQSRRDDFAKELTSKLPARAQLIDEGHGQPAIRREDYDSTVVLVCTSSVEYVRLDDDVLRGDGKLLVGTPRELLVLIRGLANGG
ncbi:MAG: SEC-C domain-containing protein [Acidobacteria bacterium]|nr:SEC-C domain-containing protein [Acidobacteriota bacterium]